VLVMEAAWLEEDMDNRDMLGVGGRDLVAICYQVGWIDCQQMKWMALSAFYTIPSSLS